jgi:hypothetical protein
MPDPVTLTPSRQAGYHLGCAGRHLGRIIVHLWRAWAAFWPITFGALMLLGLTLVFLALFTGCVSTGGSQNVKVWNPLTWFSGSEARTQARAAARADQSREAVLKAAQRSAHESALALESAPSSRPVEIATESAQTTTGLLDQALGSVPLDELATLRARVAALLSENAAVRAEAEKDRARARADAAQLSRDLAALAAAKAKTDTDLAAAFARENALANKHRNTVFALYGAATLAVIAAAGWVYVRFFAAVPTGILGKVLAFADRDAPHKAAAMRDLLDPYLNRAEQARILAAATKTAAKIR